MPPWGVSLRPIPASAGGRGMGRWSGDEGDGEEEG